MQLFERNHELKPERVATRPVLDQQVLFPLEGHAAGLADRQCDLCAKVEGATAIANAGGAVGVDGHYSLAILLIVRRLLIKISNAASVDLSVRHTLHDIELREKFVSAAIVGSTVRAVYHIVEACADLFQGVMWGNGECSPRRKGHVVLTDVDRRAQRIASRGRLIFQFPVPVKDFVMVEDREGYDAAVSDRPLGILFAREMNLLVDEGRADPAAYFAAKQAYTRVPFQLGGEGEDAEFKVWNGQPFAALVVGFVGLVKVGVFEEARFPSAGLSQRDSNRFRAHRPDASAFFRPIGD